MWNYRVVRTTGPDGEQEFSIRRAYYGSDGRVDGIGDARVTSDSREGVLERLLTMQYALQEPNVEYDCTTEELREPDLWLGEPWPTQGRIAQCQTFEALESREWERAAVREAKREEKTHADETR